MSKTIDVFFCTSATSKNPDQLGDQVSTTINLSDPMSVSMESFSSIEDIESGKTRFYFQGVIISPHSTGLDIGLDDGCEIDIHYTEEN